MPAEEIAAGLAEIKAPAGVFAVLGNHDEWYGKKEMAAALAARGIMVLQNDGRQIDYQGISFYLGGVEDVSTAVRTSAALCPALSVLRFCFPTRRTFFPKFPRKRC